MLRIIPGLGWGLFALDIARFFFPQIDTALANVWAKLKPILAAGWQKALAAGAAVSKAAKGFGRSIFSFFTTTIPAWVKATGAWFGRQYEAAIAKAMTAGQWLADAVQALLDSISQFFSDGFAEALEIGEEVIGKITTKFEEIGTRIVEAIKKPFADLGAWIAEQIPDWMIPDGAPEGEAGNNPRSGRAKPAERGAAAIAVPGAAVTSPVPVSVMNAVEVAGLGEQIASAVALDVPQSALLDIIRRKTAEGHDNGMTIFRGEGLGQPMPEAFDEAGPSTDAKQDAFLSRLGDSIVGALKESGIINAEAKIDVNLRLPRGAAATGITNSGPGLAVQLNAGLDPLAPV